MRDSFIFTIRDIENNIFSNWQNTYTKNINSKIVCFLSKFTFILVCLIIFTNLSIANQPDTSFFIQKLENIDWDNSEAFKYFDTYIDEGSPYLSKPTIIGYYKQALQEAQRINNDSLSIGYSRKMITWLRTNGNYADALSYVDVSLYHAEKANDFNAISNILIDKGITQAYQEDLIGAIDSYLLAIEADKKGKGTNVYIVYNNLAFCYFKVGQLKEAAHLIKKNIRFYEENPIEEKNYFLATNYNAITSCYKELGDKDSTRYYINKLVEFAPALEQDSLFQKRFARYGYTLSHIYKTLATFFLDEDEMNKAKIYYNKFNVLKVFEGFNNYILDTKFAIKSGNNKKAKKLLENPPEGISEMPNNSYHLYAVEFYERTGDYQKSLKHFRKFNKDKVAELESNIVNISNFSKARMESIESKYEIDQLEEEKKNQENKNRLFSLIIASITTVLALLFYAFIQVKRKKELLEEGLKNKELIEKQVTELRKADEEKLKLFVNIAHEFQTPLSVIIGLSQQIQSDTVDNTRKKYLDVITRNGNVLSERINQILEFSKLKNYKPQIITEYFYLDELINQTISELYHRAHQKNVRIIFWQSKTDQIIHSDIYKLKTILKNLIVNAIKYSDADNEINVSIETLDDSYAIRIEDNGVGISENSLTNLFDRYYQSVTNNPEGGFGIGLSICKEYTNLLGGSINVESTLGVGSVFKITIPSGVASLEVKETEITRFEVPMFTSVSKMDQTVSQGIDKKRILIVEDNYDFYIYLNSVLQKKYDIQYFSNGEKALEYLSEHMVELIITDWMMPQKSGLDLVSELKEDSELNEIPVILLTARNLITDQVKAVKKGVDAYLIKPVNEDVLFTKISDLINKKTEKAGRIQEMSYRNSIITDLELNEMDQDWIYNLEKLVLPHITNFDLNLSSVAEFMGVSRTHLNKKVKDITGLTTMRFIQELRYWEARRMFEENNVESVKMACLSVGFRDIKNFSRNFKKRFDKYPSEYLI